MATTDNQIQSVSQPPEIGPQKSSTSDKTIIWINGNQYDVTNFLKLHPGGKKVLLEFNNQDATEAFKRVGHSDRAKSMMNKYLISENGQITNVQVFDKSTEQDVTSSFLPGWSHYIFYYGLSFLGAMLISVAAMTPTQSWQQCLVDGNPVPGQLGFGIFTIIGKNPKYPFFYPFRLAVPTIPSIATAWIGYLLHQFAQWIIAYLALRARQQGKVTWSKQGSVYGRWMMWVNLTFIILKIIQSRAFYDGLSSTVPEVTALGSVVMFLVFVHMLELPRRGLFFGKWPKIWYPERWHGEAAQFVRKIHPYVISFGIVYDFWFHPVESTASHLLGFCYIFLLFIQSSLIYHEDHRNRYWTTSLEAFVWLHGVVTAIFQGGEIWLMFNFGFMLVFFLTQFWGIPGVMDWVDKTSKRNWILAVVTAVIIYFAIAVPIYYVLGSIKTLYNIVFIPAMIYGLILPYYIIFLICKPISEILIQRGMLKEGSLAYKLMGTVIIILVNIGVLLSFALWFRSDLTVHYDT